MSKEKESIKRYFTADGDDRHLRNNVHKYLMRDDKSDDEILYELNALCIYQQTENHQSSLFLALDSQREIIIKKLIGIYESDFKVLKANEFNDDSHSVLVAYGEEDKKFVTERLESFTNTDGDRKILILMKQTNEATDDVKVLSTPKNENERRVFLEIIDRLHANGTFDINVGTNFGENLFHVAAHSGMIWVMEKLVEFGAKHEMLTNQDESPFYFACLNDQLEAVKWMYRQFKIDLLEFMTRGKILFKLAENGVTEVFDFIIDEIAKREGDEFVKEIMHRKSDEKQRNVLHLAAENCNHTFLMNALRYTNDLKDVDHLGLNVLQVVLRSDKPCLKMVNYLIQKQPDLLVMEDCRQCTALHLIAKHNFIDLLEEIYQKFPFYKSSFFKNFADTPSIEKERMNIWVESPGHRALRDVVKFNHVGMFQFIIDNHDKIEFENSPYISGLVVLAAENESGFIMIKRIKQLEYFNIDVADEKGRFPLIAALEARNFTNFKFLLDFCKTSNKILDNKSGLNLLGFAIADQKENEETPEITKELYTVFHDLINQGVNIEHRGKQNQTLLHEAVNKNNAKVVEQLLEHGLKVEDVNESGENALHLVRSEEVYELLKEKCANFTKIVNQKSTENSTPFGNLVMRSSLDDLRNEGLISELRKLKPEILCQGQSPLFFVSTIKVAKILLDLGVDPNATNEYEENCVHFALRNRKFDIAQFILLNSEIDRFAITGENESYLHYLIYGDDYRKFFFPGLEKLFNDQLDKFINDKTIEKRLILNTLIKSGEIKLFNHPKANFHQLDAYNITCLHSAILSDAKLPIIKFLVIEKCVDVNAVGDQDRTALMRCMDRMNTEAASYLIDLEQIDLNIADLRGDTALHYAARKNDIKIICKLLHKKVAVTKNKNNQTFHDYLNDFNKKIFNKLDE